MMEDNRAKQMGISLHCTCSAMPVQFSGKFDDKFLYFRSDGFWASMKVADSGDGFYPPGEWDGPYYGRDVGDDASWMDLDVAENLICDWVEKYRSGDFGNPDDED